MKTLYINIIMLLGLMIGSSSCSSSEWEDVPTPIASFLSEYFPMQPVSKCYFVNDTYHVKLQNSTALSFDERYKWVSINGYGSTIPEVLLFDQLPPALYAYLQELSLTNEVYSISRDNFTYNVSLLDSSITYNIDTGIVTPDKPQTVLSAITYLRM